MANKKKQRQLKQQEAAQMLPMPARDMAARYRRCLHQIEMGLAMYGDQAPDAPQHLTPTTDKMLAGFVTQRRNFNALLQQGLLNAGELARMVVVANRLHRLHTGAGAADRLRLCAACQTAIACFRCGRCRSAAYCGAACRDAHWHAGHHAECRPRGADEEDDEAEPEEVD